MYTIITSIALIAASASGAAAQFTTTTTDVIGNHMIGMFAQVGVVISQSASTGACSARAIPNSGSQLHSDALVAVGPLGPNAVAVPTLATNFCGVTISPIVKNGFRLIVVGGQFNDQIVAGGDTTTINGGSGNDTLVTFGNGNVINGNDGNDITAGDSGTSANGQNDNDIFCAIQQGVNYQAVNGGSGTDALCAGSNTTAVGIEIFGCSCS
jgi:Ca2+-binding RTX toxin-like protein